MSIPSSSEAVATTAESSPAFKASSVDAPLVEVEASVVGLHQREGVTGDVAGRLGQLVQVRRQPLGDPAVVGEDDRRPVRADQVEQPTLDRRPDRPGRQRHGAVEGGRDLEIDLLAASGIDDRDRPRLVADPAPGRTDCPQAAEVAGHLLERALGRREADSYEAFRCSTFKPLQQQGQKDPTLVRAEGVDLIDDHVRDRPKALACPACEHQVQRFGRRDQDVGRRAEQPLPLGGGRVARPDGHVERPAAARPSRCAVSRIPSSGSWRFR